MLINFKKLPPSRQKIVKQEGLTYLVKVQPCNIGWANENFSWEFDTSSSQRWVWPQEKPWPGNPWLAVQVPAVFCIFPCILWAKYIVPQIHKPKDNDRIQISQRGTLGPDTQGSLSGFWDVCALLEARYSVNPAPVPREASWPGRPLLLLTGTTSDLEGMTADRQLSSTF